MHREAETETKKAADALKKDLLAGKYLTEFKKAISQSPGLDKIPKWPAASEASPGAINGGMIKLRKPFTGPVITIAASDIAASLKLVEKNGGKTVVKRTEMGKFGAYAYFRDSEGNLLGLYEYPKM